ncbi:MAG: hypothetical protein GY863_15075 [bacterium]|nr:hypothetical protein [bacterium]
MKLLSFITYIFLRFLDFASFHHFIQLIVGVFTNRANNDNGVLVKTLTQTRTCKMIVVSLRFGGNEISKLSLNVYYMSKCKKVGFFRIPAKFKLKSINSDYITGTGKSRLSSTRQIIDGFQRFFDIPQGRAGCSDRPSETLTNL